MALQPNVANNITLTTVLSGGATGTVSIGAPQFQYVRPVTAYEAATYPTSRAAVYWISSEETQVPMMGYATETVLSIAQAADNTVTLTLTNGDTAYFAVGHIVQNKLMETESGGTSFQLVNREGGLKMDINVTEAIADVKTAINNAASNSLPPNPTFDSVTMTTPYMTSATTGVTITEFGDGRNQTTVVKLIDVGVVNLPGAAVDFAAGIKICSFPAGQHYELVYSFGAIRLECAGTVVTTDTGIGSVVASGAVAVLSGTATFEDRLTGQAVDTDGTSVSKIATPTAGLTSGIAVNQVGDVKDVFLNVAGAWNVDNTGKIVANGTIILKWVRM